jgi:hypothetical protein
MLKPDLQIILKNVRDADTTDLLDRITAYRAGMEPEVVGFIEDELEQRGISAVQIADHAERCRRECLFHNDGSALMCSFCRRPAVAAGWAFHRMFHDGPVKSPLHYSPVSRLMTVLFRYLPFGWPRWCHYCPAHRPVSSSPGGTD